jgi:hypothetical protein
MGYSGYGGRTAELQSLHHTALHHVSLANGLCGIDAYTAPGIWASLSWEI